MMNISVVTIPATSDAQVLTDHIGFFKVISPTNYYSADGTNFYAFSDPPFGSGSGVEARFPTSLWVRNSSGGAINVTVVTWY